jgi:hypothetical protein
MRGLSQGLAVCYPNSMANKKLDSAEPRPPRSGAFLAPPSPLASKCISGEYEAEYDDDMGVTVHSVKLVTFQDLAKSPPKKSRIRKPLVKKAIKKKAKRKPKRSPRGRT